MWLCMLSLNIKKVFFPRYIWPGLEKGDKKLHIKPSNYSSYKSIETHMYWGSCEVWQGKCVQSACSWDSCIDFAADNHSSLYGIYHEKVRHVLRKNNQQNTFSRKTTNEDKNHPEICNASDHISTETKVIDESERRNFCRSCGVSRGDNVNGEQHRNSRQDCARYKADEETCNFLRDK